MVVDFYKMYVCRLKTMLQNVLMPETLTRINFTMENYEDSLIYQAQHILVITERSYEEYFYET